MKKGKIFVRDDNIDKNSKEDSKFDIERDPFQDKDNESDDDEIHYKSNIFNPYNSNYEEIYQFLLSLLKGNEFTLTEVLKLAKVMFKEGVRTPEMASAILKNKKKEINVQNISTKQVRSR